MKVTFARCMKGSILVVVCLGFVFSAVGAEKAPMVFGIKPGMLIQSSYFGKAFTRVEPYVGLDWVGIAESGDDGDMSASIFVPHLGAKLFLKDYRIPQTVAPYFIGDYFFSISSVNVDGYSSAEEDYTKELLDFWGLGIGFGAEYFFTEHFSVGGEYGLRYLHDSVDEHSEEHYYGGYGPYVDKVNDKFSVAFKLTYAAISANFFF